MIESPDISPSHVDASQPSLGFPLGTALLLIFLFSLSGIFSCCYHWDKLRSLRQSFSNADSHLIQSSLTKSKPYYTELRQEREQSLPVLMPGEKVPKFMAMPCPREPSRPDNINVTVDRPPHKPRRLSVPLCI